MNVLRLTAVTLLSAVALPVFGQTSNAQPDRFQTVSDFQAHRFDAMIRNDIDAVADYLADDLIYTHSSGETETKDAAGKLSAPIFRQRTAIAR